MLGRWQIISECYKNMIFFACMQEEQRLHLSRNNQQYALICTTALFYKYILAPTCFGNSLPSSGSFLDPSELHEIQIEWVVQISAYCWLFLLR
jgi:hypothetical protein